MPDGVILRTGQAWHTNLWDVFHAMDGVLLTHNWLITDWACNQDIHPLPGSIMVYRVRTGRAAAKASGFAVDLGGGIGVRSGHPP